MSSYEEYIIKILKKYKVSFIREKTYKGLKQGRYRYDFYLPQYNCLIEVDGQFHFHPIQGRAALNKQMGHDKEKNSFALARGIKLYRIPYWEIENIKTFDDIFQQKFLVKSIFHNDLLMIKKGIINK